MSHADWMREGYARYSARDFAFVHDYFAPDIRWHVPGPQGEIIGNEAVVHFFEGLTDMFSAHRIELIDALESEDKLWCHVHHTLTSHDGADHKVDAVHMWTLADGKASAMNEIADTLAFGVAAGMIPAEAIA